MSSDLYFPNPVFQFNVVDGLLGDPVELLANEFGLENARELSERIVANTRHLRGEHQQMVQNHAKATARSLLLRLRHLRDLGGTFQHIQQIGKESLQELESSSHKMIELFAKFKGGSVLNQRFVDFDLKASSVSKNTSTPPALSSSGITPGPSTSLLFREIDKYRIHPRQEKQSVENEVKKTEAAPFLSQIRGLIHLAEKLSSFQRQELYTFIPRALVRQNVNETLAPFALLSNMIKFVSKIAYLGGVSEGCLQTDPEHYHQCICQQRDLFEGRDPEFNKKIQESTPKWIRKAGELLAKGDAYLERFDKYMVKQFGTLPGIVHDGVEGILDVGLPGVCSIGGKLAKQAVRAVGTGLNRVVPKLGKQLVQENVTAISVETAISIDVIKEHTLATINPKGCLTKKQIDSFISDVYTLIRDPNANVSVYNTLNKQMQKLIELTPDYSLITQEKGLYDSLMSRFNKSNSPLEVQVLKSAGYEREITKISRNGDALTVRKSTIESDLFNEALTLNLLSSLELKNMQTPKLLAIGKYGPSQELFLARTFLPGETLGQFYDKLVALPRYSGERKALFKEFAFANYRVGRALGELHVKSAQYASPLTATEVKESFKSLSELGKNLNICLEKKGLPLLDHIDPLLEKMEYHLLNEMRATKLHHTFCIYDIHLDQIAWSSKQRTLGLFDSEGLGSSFNTSKQPLDLPMSDYVSYICFLKLQEPVLTFAETQRALSALKKGMLKEIKAYRLDEFVNYHEMAHALEEISYNTRSPLGHPLAIENVKNFNLWAEIAFKKYSEPTLTDAVKTIPEEFYRFRVPVEKKV